MAAKRKLVAPSKGNHVRGAMTMRFPPGGWSIWVRDSNSERHFIVAISNEVDAMGAVILIVPGAQLISSEQLPHDVVLSLGVPQGKIVERGAAHAEARVRGPVSPSAD